MQLHCIYTIFSNQIFDWQNYKFAISKFVSIIKIQEVVKFEKPNQSNILPRVVCI